jgi:hypothetical protein
MDTLLLLKDGKYEYASGVKIWIVMSSNKNHKNLSPRKKNPRKRNMCRTVHTFMEIVLSSSLATVPFATVTSLIHFVEHLIMMIKLMLLVAGLMMKLLVLTVQPSKEP